MSLKLIITHRSTMASPSTPSFSSFSLSSPSRLIMDMDGGTKPLPLLTLYVFYFQFDEVNKFGSTYILIFMMNLNLI